MNLLNKLTIKNLKLNKKRSIVTIIGIILSVALITALSSMYVSFIDSSIEYETLKKGNYHVSLQDVPQEDIQAITNNTKIEEISVVQDIGYAKLEGAQNEYKPYAYIKAYDENALKNLSGILYEGRLPQNNKEIVIPEHLKSNGKVNLKVGDKVTLNIGDRVSEGQKLSQQNPFAYENDEQIINMEEQTYTIVGVVDRPFSEIESYTSPGYTFITHLEEDNIENKVDVFVLYNKKGVRDYLKVTANIIGIDEELFIKANDEEKSLELTDEELVKYQNLYENAKYKLGKTNTYLIKLQTNPFSLSENTGLAGIVVVVCIIIIVTSVFCIKNSFDISITEKIKQYGMLKSIGATKKQVKKNVLFEAEILGIISIPIGIIFGLLASFILIQLSNILLIKSMITGYKLIFSASIPAILISIILGIITIYFSAIKSARKASKVTPIESIRNSGNIKIKGKKLRTSKFIKNIFGIGGVITLKNLKRNKKRYRTTIISLTISIGTFIGLFYFITLMKESTEQQFRTVDYNFSYTINQYETYTDKIEQTLKLNTIEKYSLIKNTEVTLLNPRYNEEYDYGEKKLEDETKNKSVGINIVTVGNDEYQRYIKELGLNNKDMDNKAILIDTMTLYTEEKGKQKVIKTTNYCYNAKDKIAIEAYQDEIYDDQKQEQLEIALVTDRVPMGVNNYEPTLIVSDEYFKQNNIETSSISVYFATKDADKLQSEIEEILGNVKYEFINVNELKEEQDNILLLFEIFLYGFISVISLIGITNIFNTITTSMELRKQEFAILKSIGTTTKEFNRMINLESIFIGSKSLLYGTIVGGILSFLLYKIDDSYRPFKFPIMPVVLCVVVVLIFITALMKYSINKINRQNTIDTIRNENI